MTQFHSPFRNLKIASPCSADWDGMYGTDRKRFCGECKLNVYNLSAMTTTEAESFLRQAEGRVCVRYYRRADGTVLTEDCPVGLAKLKKRVRTMATAVFSLLISILSGIALANLAVRDDRRSVMGEIPAATPTPVPSPTPAEMPLMGAVKMSDESDVEMGKMAAPRHRR